jgi:hypothetical protein
MTNQETSPISFKKIPIQNVLTGIIVVFLSLHMFTMPFVVYPTLGDKGPTWLGLDVSWQMTLNYARMENLHWGKDIIFSYGPLSFLSTRNGWGVSRWVFLLFDLFLVVNFFLVFREFVKKAVDKFMALLILAAVTLLCNPFYGTDLSWVLLVFTLYWMYKAFLDPKPWYFMMIAVLTALSFYIKLNTALVVILLVAGYLVNGVVFKKISWLKAGIAAGGMGLLIVLLSLFFHVSLFHYIRASLEVIKGYNEVMYLEQEHRSSESHIRILYWLSIVMYGVFAFLLVKTKRYAELFFVVAAWLYLFLMKKQAVTRNDEQHLREFISYSSLLFTTSILLYLPKVQRFFLSGMVTIVLLALFYRTEEVSLDKLVRGRFNQKHAYRDHFKYYKPGFYLSQAGKRMIPAPVLAKIGQHSIDVFPWDGEYLLENKLNYTPRPVFQSYSAYTGYLEKKNYDFYREKTPEFVLYDYDAIDGRYPFNDETWVNLFLSRNYTLADTFTSNERWRLLLQKKPAVVNLNWELAGEKEMNIDQEIPVDNATCMKIYIRHNLRGKWRSMRYKVPPVTIRFMKPNGEWAGFRTSGALLRSGIMVEKWVQDTGDFVKYITQRDSLLPVLKVKLQVDQRFFASKIQVKYYRIVP